MSDPRTRRSRHQLTPENLASTIQVTAFPADWTQETVTSVMAGSGPIVEVSSKTDPRTGKLSAVLLDFQDSESCKRAFSTLQKIERLPCEMERVIPANYQDRTQREELKLTRDHFPWDAALELPFEMVSEIPIPRRPTQNSQSLDSSTSNNSSNIVFPEILSKASDHLPSLEPGSLSTPDEVSENLSKIPPLQLIEIISNLKILANQDPTKREPLENFLRTNKDIAIAVTQAILEMGFINYGVVTQVLKRQPQARTFATNTLSNTSSSSNTPLQPSMTPLNSMPMSMPMPMAPPFVPPPIMQQPPQPQFGFAPAMPFIPMQQSPQPVMQPMAPMMNTPPVGPKYNWAKLDALPQEQQDMIKQVLKLTDEQTRQLPADQQSMVANLKKEYIL